VASQKEKDAFVTKLKMALEQRPTLTLPELCYCLQLAVKEECGIKVKMGIERR